MSARRRMNDYLDGRLTPAERTAFETELAADAALAAELRETERAVALLRGGLPARSAPPALADGVMARVRELPAPRRRWSPADLLGGWLRPQRLGLATALAAAVVMMLVMAQEPGRVVVNHGRQAVELSPSDEALVRQCMIDYHAAVLKRARQAPPTQEDGLYDAALGL